MAKQLVLGFRQIVILGSWDRAPLQALGSVWSLLVPLPLFLLPGVLSLFLINKVFKNKKKQLIHNIPTPELFTGPNAISLAKTWVGAWFWWWG